MRRSFWFAFHDLPLRVAALRAASAKIKEGGTNRGTLGQLDSVDEPVSGSYPIRVSVELAHLREVANCARARQVRGSQVLAGVSWDYSNRRCTPSIEGVSNRPAGGGKVRTLIANHDPAYGI